MLGQSGQAGILLTATIPAVMDYVRGEKSGFISLTPRPPPRFARENLTTVVPHQIPCIVFVLILDRGQAPLPLPVAVSSPTSLTMAFVPVTAGVAPALPGTFTAAFAPATAGAAAGPADTLATSFPLDSVTLQGGLATQPLPTQSLTMATSVVGAAGALPTRAGVQINPISPDELFHTLDNTYGAYLLGTFFGIL